MAKCKSPPRSATQEQVRKPKLAGKVMKQKISPKLIEGRSFTLLKKREELATLCNAQVAVLIYGSDGNVHSWPNNSNTIKEILLKYKQAAGKKIRDRSFKSMEHKVADTTGEGLDQDPCSEGLDDYMGFELRDEEFEKALTGFLESKEQNSDETINLIEDSSQPIEGSKSVEYLDNNSNCNPPTELTEKIWDDLMSEEFDKGQTLFTDSVWPWQASEYTGFDSGGIGTSTSNSLVYQNSHYPNSPNGIEQLGFSQASGDFENYSYSFSTGIGASGSSYSLFDDQNSYYPDFPTGIGASSSSSNLDELGHDQWGILQANGDFGASFISSGSDGFGIKKNGSLEDFERWFNDEMMTGSEEHQSCASAAGTSGYSTPTSCQSGRWWPDSLASEAATNNTSNPFLDDHDQQGMMAPNPSPLEEVLMSALQPKHVECHKIHELIVID